MSNSSHVAHYLPVGQVAICGEIGTFWATSDLASVDCEACKECLAKLAHDKLKGHDILTAREHDLVKKLGDIAGEFGSIFDSDPISWRDLDEVVLHVHALQNMVLSIAARRLYPERYRMLGGAPITPPADKKES